MKKKTAREEQAERTRRHILETALGLFVRQGIAGTSTRQIARVAGVSEGLVFHHFPRKRDLLAGLREGRRGMSARIIDSLGEGHDVPVTVVVREITSGFVELLSAQSDNARLFQIVVGEARHDPELGAMVADTIDRVVEAMTGYLRARIEAGEVRADLGCEAAATSLLGSLFWFYVSSRDPTGEGWRAEARAYVDQVVDLWLRGALA